MKFLKYILLTAFFALFIYGCSRTATAPSNTANVNLTNGGVVTAGSPTATYDAGGDQTGSTDELASGRKIYEEKCIKCHKADGMGGVTDIEGTKIKAPNFTTDKQKAMPDSEYIDTIENGAKEDGMPAYKGKISDDDIKNLVKYIRKNFQGKS